MTGVTVRIGTRRSELALWQAEAVAARLRAVHPTLRVEMIPMTTSGDRASGGAGRIVATQPGQTSGARPGAASAAKALFTKELEDALLDGRIDLAVHSLKDVAARLPDGLCLGAFPFRADPRDVLISGDGSVFADLPSGAVIGTASLRRQAQLLHLRRDVSVVDVRGNVPTRIGKVTGDGGRRTGAGRASRPAPGASRQTPDERYDAVVLAAAGVERLGLLDRVTQHFALDDMLPAAGQGTVVVEMRAQDSAVSRWTVALDDNSVRTVSLAERSVIVALGADCRAPVAAFAEVSGARCVVRSRVLSPDGTRMLEERLEGRSEEAEHLGKQVGVRLLERGARALIDG